MKKWIALLICLTVTMPTIPAFASELDVDATSAFLIEKETGTVLFEKNAHEALEPASVTKIMTLLLIMEALNDGVISKDEMVTTSAHAASMGGSQVFLKENETMSVHEMLKAIAVASGNDASVAMAEHIAGSESIFVDQMNAKAAQIGMNDTVFQNCTGLPADNHLTSAHDIAIMSRELILHHPSITEYTTIWMDTLRNGDFQLANTNKLIYYYEGATGLKTGFTDSAKFCLSASAKKDNMELIAVVLGSPTSPVRFESAKQLLNYGFSTYTLADLTPTSPIPPVAVALGKEDCVQPILSENCHLLIEKAKANKITTSFTVLENITAPVAEGQELGEMIVYLEEEVYDKIPLVAEQAIDSVTIFDIFKDFMKVFVFNHP